MSLPTSVEVLVVGAGPTGLAASTALARSGVEVLTVDAAAEISTQSRAAGVQPRTLEQLARLDAAEPLVAQGLRGAAFAAATPGGTLLRVPFSGLDTLYPYVLLVPQSTTEQVLADALTRAGGEVNRRHRVVWAEPEFDAVTVGITDPEGVLHVVRAKYVVAGDGLHSGMRKRAGIEFAGRRDDQHYLLGDVEVGQSTSEPQVTFCFSPEGLLLVSPLPGSLVRLVAGVHGGTPAGPMDTGTAQRLIDERAPADLRLRVRRVAQSSPYQVSTRMAERFRAGRIFLAGDAAHVHSPAGGQGMNTGIQDAVNLGWKLAAVLREGAPETLLDSYGAERRPNAAALLAFTEQMTGLATLTDPAAMTIRDEMLAAAGRSETAPGFLARRLSQLDVTAGAGRRVAPREDEGWARELRWALLTPVHAAAAAEEAVRGTPVVTGTAPAGSDALLVRPDGYLAKVGSILTAEGLRSLIDSRHRPA
jgi:2-polyprenyl-6-methoxyphenol hydroxylase-like FAD-dependent oxidoreductase